MPRTSVDLPDPLGPSSATTSPLVQLEVDAADHGPVGVAEGGAVQADEGRWLGHEHSCPARRVARLARMTSR